MCKCCEEIKLIKDMSKETIKGIKRELKASITSFSMKGKEVRGVVEYGTFDLKFCPSCGRKLGD